MIMSTFKRIAVSNWELYQKSHGTDKVEAYVEHLVKLQQGKDKPDMLILREKNLSEEAYQKLLGEVWKRFEHSSVELMPHTYLRAAQNMGISGIHLPFLLFQEYRKSGKRLKDERCLEGENLLKGVNVIGTSVHSVEEAVMAEQLGASYLTAGHIFATNCKPDLEPRGLKFLQNVCKSVKIPVYAIGGIHSENLEIIEKSSAAGACMMSEYMK